MAMTLKAHLNSQFPLTSFPAGRPARRVLAAGSSLRRTHRHQFVTPACPGDAGLLPALASLAVGASLISSENGSCAIDGESLVASSSLKSAAPWNEARFAAAYDEEEEDEDEDLDDDDLDEDEDDLDDEEDEDDEDFDDEDDDLDEDEDDLDDDDLDDDEEDEDDE